MSARTEQWTPAEAERYLQRTARTTDTHADRLYAQRVIEYPTTGPLHDFAEGGRFYRPPARSMRDGGNVAIDDGDAPAAATRVCAWCGADLSATRGRFCSKRCRQTAFRIRRRAGVAPAVDAIILPASATLGRFAYADPPYLGLAKKYYQHELTYGGEVDHVALIASLRALNLTGWALSASPGSLATLLPLCPAGVRVCPWVKPIGVSRKTWGAHNTWEAVIVAGGRPQRPGIRDWLRAMPARGGGTLVGRKPIAFCAWLFDLLGMRAGDELLDLFPGSGVVARAWGELGGVPRPRLASLLEERQEATA